MTSETNYNTHVADDNTVIFKSVELTNSEHSKHDGSEKKTEDMSNNTTDNDKNQILSGIVDGDDDYNDEEEIKHDQSAIVSCSVTTDNYSHRSNMQIYTDTNTTPAFDYWFVLYILLIFLSVGFIIYIFTSIAWIVLLFSAVGFTVSVTYEYIQYTNAKK
eukprot:894021_1